MKTAESLKEIGSVVSLLSKTFRVTFAEILSSNSNFSALESKEDKNPIGLLISSANISVADF